MRYEEQTVARVLLDKILFETRQQINVPHGLVFEMLPDVGRGMALSLRGYVWGQKLQNEKVTLSVQVPATWWQMLKEHCYGRNWAPAWVRRRWPVGLRKVEQSHTFETIALLPGFKYEAPRGEAYIMSTTVGRSFR